MLRIKDGLQITASTLHGHHDGNAKDAMVRYLLSNAQH